MTLTEEQRGALKRVVAYMDDMYAIASPYHGCTEDANLLRAMIDSSDHIVEPDELIGFDLERARGLRDFLQDDCAEVGDVWGEMIAEIERLRIELEKMKFLKFLMQADDDVCIGCAIKLEQINELEADLAQSEICIRARMECIDDQAAYIKELESSLDEAETLTKKNAELMNGYLARIAELEDALVEERAGAIRCEFYDHCEIDLPDAMIRARQELQADGKIGPDAKSVNKGNQCQYCKKCGRDMRFEFSIRDEIWNKLPKTWKDRVLCIECFLEELNEVEPDQEIHFDDFNYMCILDPIEDTEWKGDRPKLLHPLFGGTLIDAKNPLAWQITEERVGLLEYCLETLLDAPDIEEIPGPGHSIEMLRAMLREAE